MLVDSFQVSRARVGLVDSPASEVVVDAVGLGLPEAERQGALERRGMALSHQFVAGGTALLLRALRAKQVTEARRASHELAPGGQFEPLGNGLLGLLHGK